MGDSSRKRLKARHSDLYRSFWPERQEHYLQCFYCGDPADTMDHQPALSRVDEYRTLNLEIEEFVKVPSCSECNSLLGSELTETLVERESLLKQKLRKRYKRDLSAVVWDEDEMEELGPRMREMVEATMLRKEWLADRLQYQHGVSCWLREPARKGPYGIVLVGPT